MSAWAGEPDHFAKRFEAEGGERRGFAPRRLFGRYVGDILQDAIATGRAKVIQEKAVLASQLTQGWRIGFANGDATEASALVLAVGNQEPEPLSAFRAAGDRFIANPWGADARAAVTELAATGEPALIVGTGLTMVDLALSLDAAGYRGKMVALSRRGLIPRAHADFDPVPVNGAELPHGDLRGLWRWLRRRAADVGWRAAVDGLRPHSHALWQNLDGERQRRFLRHARPWWDVHRHRIAPEVARTIAGMIAESRLEVVAGRVISSRLAREGLELDFRRRGAATAQSITVAYAFNCTGPLHSIARTRDPLLRSLLDAGRIRADHLGLGIDVDDRSRARGADRLWALGPLTKGRYWEIIAVPDIREQAAAVAEDIAVELVDESSV
jgi:uncharacterized NAD(P)/FAD-binding protein YdhS